MAPAQWKGHDRHRDLPMLGIDPDAKSDWEPIDDGRRPDNRDPLSMSIEDGFGDPRGVRVDIGPIIDYSMFVAEGDGRKLMEYHRDLATRLTSAKDVLDVVLDHADRARNVQ